MAPMRFRKLRIAWSVMWGLAAVLMVVVWVRSYWWVDQVFVPVTKSIYFVVGSIPNAFGIGFGEKSPTVTQAWLTNRTAEWITVGEPHDRSFYLTFFRLYGASAMMPYWCGVLLSASIATLPWRHHLHFRFSLRTLLIATTLVAVVLGAIVYAVR